MLKFNPDRLSLLKLFRNVIFCTFSFVKHFIAYIVFMVNCRQFPVVLMNVRVFRDLILGFYTSHNSHCCLHLVLTMKN